MEIRPLTFHVKDDFGLIFEIKPLFSILSEDAANEISFFFSKYRITSAYKDTNALEKPEEGNECKGNGLPARR